MMETFYATGGAGAAVEAVQVLGSGPGHSGWGCRLTMNWKRPANASVTVWTVRCAAAQPENA